MDKCYRILHLDFYSTIRLRITVWFSSMSFRPIRISAIIWRDQYQCGLVSLGSGLKGWINTLGISGCSHPSTGGASIDGWINARHVFCVCYVQALVVRLVLVVTQTLEQPGHEIGMRNVIIIICVDLPRYKGY